MNDFVVLHRLLLSLYSAQERPFMAKLQEGYWTEECGSYIGHYSIWLVDEATGKKKRRQRAFKIGPVKTTTMTAVKLALREAVTKAVGVTADSRVTLRKFVETRWIPLREGEWRDSTRQTNLELLRIVYDRFGSDGLEDIDSVMLQSWLNSLAKKRSGSVVRHIRFFLKAIFLEAIEQDFLKKNPARTLRLPKDLKSRKKEYLTKLEVKTLLGTKWITRDNIALLTIMAVMGLRPSELFALRWRCFNKYKSTLSLEETIYRGVLRPFTKTTIENDEPRFLTLPVPMPAYEALMRWKDPYYRDGNVEPGPDEFIFAGPGGNFLHKENYLRRTLIPWADRAGVRRFNYQMLRRTMATHAQHSGSGKDIAVLLRHKDEETAAKHYIMEIDESVRAASERIASNMLGE
jgi:integrase